MKTKQFAVSKSMKLLIFIFISFISFTSFYVISSAHESITPVASKYSLDRGYIKGSNGAYIMVWEEKADNSRGTLLYNGRIERDQVVSLSTERGRIIFIYRYSMADNWNTEVHAWCHAGGTTMVP